MRSLPCLDVTSPPAEGGGNNPDPAPMHNDMDES